MVWEFYEKMNHWVVRNIETDETYRVLTKMCAIELSAKLNEYEIRLNGVLQ